LDIRHGQIVPPQARPDAGPQLGGARQGRLEQLVQDAFDDRGVNFPLAQDKGPHILPALPKILEMLAGGLAVGTAYEHGSLLQSDRGLAVSINQQPEPDQGEVPIAGRIGQPLRGKLRRPYPKARPVHLHAQRRRVDPWLHRQCGLMRHGSNPPVGRGVGEHPILSTGMALRACFSPPRARGNDRLRGHPARSKPMSSWDGRPRELLLAKKFFLCMVSPLISRASGLQRSRLVMKRTIGEHPSYWYYISNAPVSTRLPLFVWLSGVRWAIEQCFEETKTALGMDQYEIRKYTGWHHHILTCMLAHFFLWHVQIRLGKKSPGAYRIAGEGVTGGHLTRQNLHDA